MIKPSHHLLPKAPASAARGRALATPVVLMMLSLLAVTAVALALVFAIQARRTRAVADGAQLRQLLLAGQTAALSDLAIHSAPASGKPRDVDVPTQLAGADQASLTLHLESTDPAHAQVKATARYHHQSAVQMLSYTLQDNHWKLAAASLQAAP